MKLTYTERNGLLYPDLELPPQKNSPLGKYGRLRLDFIKQHCRETYGSLRAQAKLNEYLHEIDEQATEMVQSIMSDPAKKNGIDEKLKVTDPLRWVQEMNALKAAAEEIVFREIVYQ
jgi:hypothetical protein